LPTLCVITVPQYVSYAAALRHDSGMTVSYYQISKVPFTKQGQEVSGCRF
jgi:hypothetical protein